VFHFFERFCRPVIECGFQFKIGWTNKLTVYLADMVKLPEELLNSIDRHTHLDRQAFAEAHQEENKITSVRLNPFKNETPTFPLSHKIPWCALGYYLDERPSFTRDPLFHAGCYYVQEPGSMFVEHALQQLIDFSQPLYALDLCAAPGGKSTHLNSLLSADSLLVSNEIIKSRAGTLWMNLSKWGTANSIVTNNEPGNFSVCGEFFDIVVVDAPCSGSGLFRKQPEALAEWSPDMVTMCAARQKQILPIALKALAPGGILFYSTCSYSYEENEDIVNWLVKEHGLQFERIKTGDEGIVQTEWGYRFYPHLTRSEGFFCAVLRKESGGTGHAAHLKTGKAEKPKHMPALPLDWLAPNDLPVVQVNENYHLMSHKAAAFFTRYRNDFFLRKAGTTLGALKGSDFIPSQELAWSIDLSTLVPACELSLEDSIRYLKKENLTGSYNHRGTTLITHRGRGLGWAKFLGNRVNNYLPANLRIIH
jgi:16S rRNA C967 or C1407 C5-methylase (RsmB/RsmF family)/NOL1/NOP2/fmu family ribosome biogenesis protein